jgi:hypothetical protein
VLAASIGWLRHDQANHLESLGWAERKLHLICYVAELVMSAKRIIF